MEWIKADRVPRINKSVLATDGKNSYIAFYIEKNSEQFECDEDECSLFDVDDDGNYFWQEGWYTDENIPNGYYDSYWVKRDITHWMALPEKPME